MREVKHWHKLPKEVVESPPLQILKTQLNIILSNPLHLRLLEWGLGLEISRGVFQSQQLFDSVTCFVETDWSAQHCILFSTNEICLMVLGKVLGF